MITMNVAFCRVHHATTDRTFTEMKQVQDVKLRGSWVNYPFADIRMAIMRSRFVPAGEGWHVFAYELDVKNTDMALAFELSGIAEAAR